MRILERDLGARPILIGHSMGGLIVQKVIEQTGARAAALLCSAPPRGIPVLGLMLIVKQIGYVGDLIFSRAMTPNPADLESLMRSTFTPDERALLRERLVPDSGRVGRELTLGAVRVDAERVRCPMLVIGAGRDRLVPKAVASKLASRYHAPVAMYEELGHFLIWERGWERPAARIAEWIDRLMPA